MNGDRTLQLSSCKFLNITNSIFSNYVFSENEHYKTHESDWVMGAFMMINTNFYNDVGGLNESYFMYSEDTELCYKVKKSGGKVIFYSEAEIVHLYNQSGKNKFNKKRDKVVTESTIKFVRENYRGIEKYGVILIQKSRCLLKQIIKR
ncbi:hypothetical protein SDC9_135329 [bioreactor metagenome]|uniref:Galactosyltransferase C-terminal domain-containing protein n=1 Tax=bioreactor metagenome TaxID=1076179 RepID=A0A645DGR3_9ZZZZ